MQKVLSKKMLDDAYKYSSEISSTKDSILKTAKAVFSEYNYKGKTLLLISDGLYSDIGLELSKIIKQEGEKIEILKTIPIKSEQTIEYLSDCIKFMIPIYEYNDNFSFYGYDTIIDSMHMDDAIDEDKKIFHSIANKINSIDVFVLSIGMITGLDTDNGIADNPLLSNLLIASPFCLVGNLINDAKDCYDILRITNGGIPYLNESYYLYDYNDFVSFFKKRKYNSHKGTYGYVGVMGGSYKFSGAIKLSSISLSTLVSGAGVSRIIAPSVISDSILPYILEQTLYPLSSNNDGFVFEKEEIDNAIKGLSSLSFGMGVGTNEENKKILAYLLNNYDKKLLIDADGLNILSTMDLNILNKSNADIILTPHIKEFSRLINVPIKNIIDNPIFYCLDFSKKYNCVLVLKGTTTIIAKSGKIYFVSTGSMSLSKGGSGDMLSGIITGMLGYEDALSSALAGCYLFGKAGDNVYKKYGSYAPLSKEILQEIKEILKKF